MGTNIEFAKSLYISVNGTNKVSLPYLLLPYVILAHYGAVKGDLEGIFISEFPHQEILKYIQRFCELDSLKSISPNCTKY